LHFYHGALGAIVRGGSGCCFDTTFYAGYPKTPVFDSDCRPAEWFLTLGGRPFSAASYKIGLAVGWWLTPLGFWAAARVAGLGSGSAACAAFLAVLVTWASPALRVLENGDIVLPLVAVLAALHLALFARCHDRPSAFGWLGLFGTESFGWSLQPLLWSGVALFGIGCWLGAGRRHRLAWHLGLLLCHLGALVVSYPTWDDWLRYWWIRSPQRALLPDLAGQEVISWGFATFERLIFLLLLLSGVGGGLRKPVGTRSCPTKWQAFAAGVTFSLCAVSSLRDPALPISTLALCALGLWLAVVPAARTITHWAAWLVTASGRQYAGLVIGGSLFLLVGGLVARRPAMDELPNWGPRPLARGLPPAANTLAQVLSAVTTPEARILWEDSPRRAERDWAVLLPRRLGRSFLGGLDPNGVLEHSSIGLREGLLAGRPLAAWTDEELEGYCRRYNVGWVVCTTPEARERIARWSAATAVPVPPEADAWRVFALRRSHTYVLKGSARSFDADIRRVTLADVVPEDGEVVLSLHYQEGWRVRPAWVQVERELDPYDPIPFVRLRTSSPVGRVTLTWEMP
jgi:hypothetical protein